MPITEFQRSVLLAIKPNRNPNSYVAGGIAIHRDSSSVRYSNDIDFFHDLDEAVSVSYSADAKLLKKSGYLVDPSLQQTGFIRATISRGSGSLKLEWVRDTAFRFFPALEDAELGYRLHDVDLAVNKVLALANRNAVRDIIDVLQLNKTTITFAAACWAACGKDPGFTPDILFECISRNSIIRPEQLSAEALTEKFSAPILKSKWLELMNQAKADLKNSTAAHLGCIYLDHNGNPVRDPFSAQPSKLTPHFGSIHGSWPQIAS